MPNAWCTSQATKQEQPTTLCTRLAALLVYTSGHSPLSRLQTALSLAQEAKQEKVVEFMTKVKQAALRYMVTK